MTSTASHPRSHRSISYILSSRIYTTPRVSCHLFSWSPRLVYNLEGQAVDGGLEQAIEEKEVYSVHNM